jgi:hypothetical protein
MPSRVGEAVMTTISSGYNQDLAKQTESLHNLIRKNEMINQILDRAPSLSMPSWYLGAGCLAHCLECPSWI